MKNTIIIFLFVIIVIGLIGCSSKENQASVSKETSLETSKLISLLEEKGYYKYIDPSVAEKVKKESIEAGYIFGWKDSGRDFQSDAESLAEGGISEFFDSIKGFLEKQNVEALVSNEDFSDKGYRIIVNGKDYEIYSQTELESEDFWELSTIRSFAIINKLLKDAGSNERLYILYGGNDLRGVFLTDEMYQLIKADKGVAEKEMPLQVQEVFK